MSADPQVTPTGQARARDWIGRAGGAVLGIAVLAITATRIGWDSVGDALDAASWGAALAAAALNVPITLLRAWRTQALLLAVGERLPVGLLVESQLVGQTLSAVTPAAAGDLWRGVMWQRRQGTPLRLGFAAVLADRVVSLGLQLGVGCVLFAPAAGGRAVAVLLAAVGAGLLVAPWALAALFRRVALLRRAGGALLGWRRLERRAEPLRAAAQAADRMLSSWRAAAAVTATSVGVFVLGGVQLILLTIGLGGAIGLSGGTAVACLSQGLGTLSTLPFGLGVGDVSTIALLGRLGLTASAGAAAAILVRLTVTLPVAAAAAGVLATRADASPLRGRTLRGRRTP